MKLAELKATGAFTSSLKKMAETTSLGDIKTALRHTNSSKFDPALVKALSFASSFRRTNVQATDNEYSCTLELPNVGMMSITFKMKNGQVYVASLTKNEDPTDAVE